MDEARRPGGRSIVLALAAVGAVLVHAAAVSGLLELWDRSPMYSYGYVVPFVAAYLAWHSRDAVAAAPRQPAPVAGGVGLALWAALVIAGHAGGVQVLQVIALIVGLVAALLLVEGWPRTRALWAPLAYLWLLVPVWDAFTEPLHQPFQQASAAMGVALLHLTGIPALRDGTFISMPNLQIEVARACSGINYLVAVVALGLPLAYLRLATFKRRFLLVASAVTIAALANGLRVALIGLLAHYDVGSPLHGPFHVLHGLFVAGIGQVVLFSLVGFLARNEQRRAGTVDAAPAATLPPLSARRPARLAPALALLFVVWAVAGVTAADRPRPVPLAAGLDTLPAFLGPWAAEPSAPTGLDWWPTADARLTRRYRTASGDVADVQVAYFSAQAQAHEVVSYRAGPLHRQATPLEAAEVSSGPAIPVNLAYDSRDGEMRALVFWYELDGVVETTPLAAKLRTLWHALGRRRTNGAAVMIAMPIAGTEDASRVATLAALAARVHAALATSLPGRVPAGAGARPGAAAGPPAPQDPRSPS
jgi:EpsI family protein